LNLLKWRQITYIYCVGLFAGLLLNVPEICLADTINNTGATGSTGNDKKNLAWNEKPIKHKKRVVLDPATVEGKITDATGEHVLPLAHIVITRDGAEHVRFDTESADDGKYTLTGLEPGKWILTVSAPAKMAQSQTIILEGDQIAENNVALADQEATDVLHVNGKRQLIHANNTQDGTIIDHTIIEQYKSGNSLRSLVESAPGVMGDSFGNIISRGEHNAVSYDLDGVTLPEAAGVLQQTQFVSPRALQAVEVDVGGYEASDGGGPEGAIVHMRSMPIQSKPVFEYGEQFGAPLAGTIHYYASGALSQDPKSILNRIRFESIGVAQDSTYRLQPGSRSFTHDNGVDLNFLNKIEFTPTERDRFKLTVGINQSLLQIPNSPLSQRAGVRLNEHDMQDFIIAGYNHKFEKFFDEFNLNVVNGFYGQSFHGPTVFDPDPVINGDNGLLRSVAPQASRFDYVLSIQSDISKTVAQTHHLKAGILSEIRPVQTNFSEVLYNADPTNGLGFGTVISPFTGQPGGPNFTNGMGRYKGSRYLQSAYFEDTWKPKAPLLQKLTLNGGVRADVYHGVFGNTLPVGETIATIPGVSPFFAQPFMAQSVTDAQLSGRYGASYLLNKHTILRASYSDLFTPPPVDVFSTPPDVTGGVGGIFPGTVRALHAARGRLIDTGVEHQFGKRVVAHTSLFYKNINNFGDSGVIANTPIYNRQTLANLLSYGVENRIDFKPGAEGHGYYGFLSNTIANAELGGNRGVTGGDYDFTPYGDIPVHADHDRRYSGSGAVGYKSKSNFWILTDVTVQTGLLDQRDPAVFGPHPARTPTMTMIGMNFGYTFPKVAGDSRWRPEKVDVRIENLLDQRLPVNLGSPFQGTRYSLPLRVLVGMDWKV
jgi:hypothetical protein